MPDAVLGVVTCRRPEKFGRLMESLEVYVGDEVAVYVHDDSVDSVGVGRAKNALLREMLEESDAWWLFVAEDDIVVRSSRVLDGYIAACEQSGFQHLNFGLHGPLNKGNGRVEGPITIYPHYVGAFSVYSRGCLEVCGLFDEVFVNCWEHVEHSARLALAGFSERGADATGSEGWLAEQLPVESVIADGNPDHAENVRRGLEHWRVSSPDTYRLVWG